MCSDDGVSLPNSPATTKENTAGSQSDMAGSPGNVAGSPGDVAGSPGNVAGSQGETGKSSSGATSQPSEPSMNGTSVGMDCSSPVPMPRGRREHGLGTRLGLL